MKQIRSLFAAFTAVLLVVVCLYVPATASAGNEGKPRSVTILPSGDLTLTKGKTRQLDYVIRPDDASIDTEVSWYSEDSSVADVDDSGLVTAIEPGETWIHIRTANNKADSVRVRVPGRYNSGPDSDPDSSRRDEDRRYVWDDDLDEDAYLYKISTAQLVEAAIAADDGPVIVENYGSVSCASLQDVMYDTKQAISFDTLYANGGVQGRVTINPKDVLNKTGDIKTSVYTSSTYTQSVQDIFQRHYTNKVAVIRCTQNQYGMAVRIAAKTGSLNTRNLRFYTYNRSQNSFAGLKVSNVVLDSNNYLNFNTNTGGYIIVSEGPLAKA